MAAPGTGAAQIARRSPPWTAGADADKSAASCGAVWLRPETAVALTVGSVHRTCHPAPEPTISRTKSATPAASWSVSGSACEWWPKSAEPHARRQRRPTASADSTAKSSTSDAARGGRMRRSHKGVGLCVPSHVAHYVGARQNGHGDRGAHARHAHRGVNRCASCVDGLRRWCRQRGRVRGRRRRAQDHGRHLRWPPFGVGE